ncbi:MAG: hypothetical protein J5J06_00295 [Phycisphaerae bacterium]|nr:hypothetical protein [Phycisphaerae bacterium]
MQHMLFDKTEQNTLRSTARIRTTTVRRRLVARSVFALMMFTASRTTVAGELCDPQIAVCFQSIGDLSGGDFFSNALGVVHVNGVVVVVGESASDATPPTCGNCREAVKFANGQLFRVVNLTNGIISSTARDIALVDGATVITGNATTDPPGPGALVTNAFRAVQVGDESVVPLLLPNAGFKSGTSISDDGMVVVGHTTDDLLSNSTAYRWTPSGGTTVLPISGLHRTAFGVSPNGFYSVGTLGDQNVPWVFPNPNLACPDPNVCSALIGGMADSATSVSPITGRAVTDTGVVVGMANLIFPLSGQEAFRWTPAHDSEPASVVALGDLPGGFVKSEALAVSNDGNTVVGYSAASLSIPTNAAFIWNSNLGMLNLRELAAEDDHVGVLDGWTLVQANAISTDGLAIAGTGLNPSGNTEGWFITLPDCNGNGWWDAAESPIPSTRTTRTVLELDGIVGFAELVAPPPALEITGDLTIEAWVYLRRIGVTQTVIVLGGNVEDPANNVLYGVEVDATGDVVVTHERSDLSDAVFVADTNLRPGRWYHLAVMRTAPPSQDAEYAVQIDDRPALVGGVGGGPDGGTSGTLRIGRGTGGAGDRQLDGFLADVRVWNVVRNAAQIHGSMFTSEPLDPDGLVASWPMDEEDGTILVDTAGSSDLTLAGNAQRATVGADCNHNGVPDACDPDCNGNGIPDECDVIDGTSCDNDLNGHPDECDAPQVLAELASADAAATQVFREERDDPVSPTTFGTMIQHYGRPWKPDTGQTPGGGICVDGSRDGLTCGPGEPCPGGSCLPPLGTGTTRDPAERLRILARNPSCLPTDVAQTVLNELFSFEMLLGNEAFSDAMDPTVGEGALGESISLDQVPGIFAFNGLPGINSLMAEELALLRGREIALPASPMDPLDDGLASNADGNYPQFGAAKRAAVYNRLRPNTTGALGSIGFRSNYGFSSTTDNAAASEAYPQGYGDAFGYYLTATTTYLDAFGAAGAEPVPPEYADLLVESLVVPDGSTDCNGADCESIQDDDGVIHHVGFRSVRNMAAAMAARARTADRIVELTFRRDYREDIDTPLTDSNPQRAWGIADWARRGAVGAYFDWAALNHLLPAPQAGDGTGVADVHRQNAEEVRILCSTVEQMQERVNSAGAGLNPLGLVPNVVPFRIIQPGQLLDFLEGGASAGNSHYGIVRSAALDAIKNARGILQRANLALNRLRTNETSFTDFEDQVRESDVGLNDRLIEIFGLPSVSDQSDNDGEDNDADGVQLTGGLNDPDDDLLESGCNGDCPGSPDLVNFLLDAQALDDLGWAERGAVGQVQLAMFELRTATLRAQIARQALANLEASIQDHAEHVALVRQEAVEELEIRADACDEQLSVVARQEELAKARQEQGFLSRVGGFFEQAAACALSGGTVGCGSALNGALGIGGEAIGQIASGSSPVDDISEQFDLQKEELRVNCWQTASLTKISNDQTIRSLEIALEDLVRRTPQAILELAVAENQARQAFAVVRKDFQEGKRLLDERDRVRRVQRDKLQDFRFRDLAYRTFRNHALEQYGAFFDLADRYVMLAARAFAYEYNERDAVDTEMRALYGEQLLGTESAVDRGLESVIARLDERRQESDFASRLQKLSLFDQGGDEFSLRKNLLGLAIDPAHDTAQQQLEKNKAFRAVLESSIVQDLLEVPAFAQLASIDSDRDGGPAIVLTFPTEVAGRTLFGRRRGTQFGAPANFDTCSNPKLFEFAILLEGVDNPSALGVDGPLIFAHFLPVGSSMLRTPTTGDCALRPVRTWAVVDQKIPGVLSAYRSAGESILDVFDLPRLATSADLYEINRFPVSQAQVRQTENPVFQDDLAGWSVWNTQWMLAIPGRQFADHGDNADVVRQKLLILIYDADANGNPRSPDANLGIDDIKIRIKAYGKPS